MNPNVSSRGYVEGLNCQECAATVRQYGVNQASGNTTVTLERPDGWRMTVEAPTPALMGFAYNQQGKAITY